MSKKTNNFKQKNRSKNVRSNIFRSKTFRRNDIRTDLNFPLIIYSAVREQK